MEPNRPSSLTDSISSYHSATGSLGQSVDGVSSDQQYGHRSIGTVELAQVLKQIPKEGDDGSQGAFTSLHEMQVDVQQPEPSRFRRAMNWLWGSTPEQPDASLSSESTPQSPSTASVSSSTAQPPAIPEQQGHWVARGLRDYVVSPVSNYVISPTMNYVVKPLTENVIKPVANRVIVKPFTNYVVPQAKKGGASILRHQILDKWVGVSFDMPDETWQQILTDVLLTSFKDLDPSKEGVYQNLTIPKLTIETKGGPVVINELRLSACLQRPNSQSTDIVHQQRKATISVHHVRCSVDIPVEYQQEPVKLDISANNGKVHLGTDIGKLLSWQTAMTLLKEGKSSPNIPHDQTAVQATLDELTVKYSNTKSAFEVDGEYADPAATTPVLAEFDTGTATLKDLTLSRKLNLIREEADQSAIAQVGSMKIDFDTDPNRPSVVALNKIELSDMDDHHNGFLDCAVTLQPQHLKRSSSMLMRLAGALLGGKTKVSLHAPVKKGDIALKDLKYTQEQLDKLPPEERAGKGYIKVESSNPLVKWLLGPLLRSNMTKIVPTPNGPAIKIGAQFEVQLPGLIPCDKEESDHGSIVMTELFDKIGGDLLKGWYIVKSKLLICPKYLEKQCILASRETGTGRAKPAHSRELVNMRKELKTRLHHSEALRASLAIPTPVYKKLIRDCEDPVERAEYYKIAHELTEVDPPKSVAIFAALLQRKHYAEEPRTADPQWLTKMALQIESESDSEEDKALVIDTLAFAYKSDPFAGCDAMCHLLRLVQEKRCAAETVTELLKGHIRNGRFDNSPKALALTVDAVALVAGDKITDILKAYPSKALAALTQTNSDTLPLIDKICNLMKRHSLNVAAADLYLQVGKSDDAQNVLETAIEKNDPDALRTRVRLEVKHGSIGHPRYIDAAKLLCETLTKPDLPDSMKEAGGEALLELWQHTHDNPLIAQAFSDTLFTRDDHPYDKFVTQLFTITNDETMNSRVFLDKVHVLRDLLLQAKHEVDIGQERTEMIEHFSKLLNNLQADHERVLRPQGLIQQLRNVVEIGQEPLENMAPLSSAPIQINLGAGDHPPDSEQAIPGWLQNAPASQTT